MKGGLGEGIGVDGRKAGNGGSGRGRLRAGEGERGWASGVMRESEA